MEIVVGIDASRNRSGGAKAHLVGILKDGNPLKNGIYRVHLWSYKSLLDAVPDFPWLIKHNPPALEKSIFHQAFWQYNSLPKEASAAGCDIMLNTDAGTVGDFHPSVVMSRDMLSYEKGEMKRFGISKARLRLLILKYVQTRSIKNADGVIFLTKYAAKTIQQFTGKIKSFAIVPHGVSKAFRQTTLGGNWSEENGKEIQCLYISNASMYKHQWHVIRAIGALKKKGYNVSLILAGGGKGKAQKLVDQEMNYTDPERKFVKQIGFVKHNEIPDLLASCDLFIFASSCENMPNTLIEGMASGLPIACSNRGPMPEVLEDGGIYFDPENSASIAEAIEKIITDKELRITNAKRAKQLSEKYLWESCADATFAYLYQVIAAKKHQVCSNCVMDTSDSKIVFDVKGVCDNCKTLKYDVETSWNMDEKDKNKLELLVSRIKKDGKDKDFDCIIGMSGGLDSSYVLYKMVTDFGLRPLVFHVDAGWNSQIAVNNIERLVDGLSLDLYTEVINWEEMKDLQLSFFKSGVPHIDVPQDHAFFATMYKFASKHNIKYILTGGNYSTECVRNPIEWMYYQSDSIQLRHIHKKYSTRELNNYPLTNILWHKVWLPYFRGIKLYRPLDYIPYIKEEAIQILVDKFGFQKYPQKHFESRFTKFYEGFWLPQRFGYDTRKVQFSSLILTGQMTRNEALEKLKEPIYSQEQISEDFEFISNKLGISTDELWEYFYAPKKTFRDYKSNKNIYALGAFFVKFFLMEKGVKR
jgi:N-acetyl sugar amidotransferase